MLVSYDEENGWGGLFKQLKGVKEITPEIENQIKSIGEWTGELNIEELASNLKITDESVIGFMGHMKESGTVYKTSGEALKGYQTYLKNTSKNATLAAAKTKLLSATMKTISTIGWALLINGSINLISKGIEYISTVSERAIEKSKQLREEFEEYDSTYSSNKETLTSLQDEYDSLTKKIEENGGVAGLTADEYERYKDITSQILGITPQLTTGWDKEGKAISNKNNLLQASIDLLDEEYQKKLRNMTTKANNETVASGVIAELEQFNNQGDTKTDNGTRADMYSAFEKELRKIEQGSKDISEYDIVTKMWEYYDPKGYKNKDFWTDAVDSYEELYGLISKDYDKFAKSFVDKKNPIYDLFSSEAIDDMIDNAQEYFDAVEQIKEDRATHYQKYQDQINLNVQAVKGYGDLTPDTKSFIDEYVKELDYAGIKTTDDFLERVKEAENFTEKIIKDKNLQKQIEKLYSLSPDDKDYVTKYKDVLKKVQNYCDENNIELPVIFTDNLKEFEKESKKKLQEQKISTQPDYSPAIEEMETSLTSLSEAQELFNTALSEQAQNGSISEETIASLRDKYEDLDKVLEITTNGVVINRDKLAELNAEEEKSINKDLSKTRKELIDQYNANSLAIAKYKMQLKDGTYAEGENEETIRALLDAKREDQKQTEEQLSQLDLLGVKYDELTSKTNKFLQSLSSADDGAIYDSVYAALEQVKEVYDAGDYGKDEFRNFVDYMTFDDMSTASIDEIKESYKSAMKTAERYFTENNEGMKNFTEDLKKLKVASRDANGNWTLNIENMDKLSKKLGISSDAAKDLLDKLKDKGWEINYTTSDDGLVNVEKELDKLNKKKKELNKKLKLETDKDAIAETKKQIKEVDNAIKGVKSEIKLSADTEKARTEILSLQKEINGLSGTYVDSYVKGETNVDRYVKGEKVKDLQKQQKAIAKEYNIDLNSVLNVETEEANGKIDETQKKAEEEQTMVVTADTNPAETAIGKVTKIFDKVYDLKIGIKIPQVDDVRNKVKSVINNATGKKGDTEANGTVITGKAYANGKRGKIAHGYKSKALVGELGAEMRVRDGKYEILGENGAEFTDVRPDDIIFNAKQTEEILKNGKTNARGNAYDGGKNNTTVSGGGGDIETHTTSTKAKETKKKQEEEKATEKAKKATEKFNEAIDWCANSISNLSRTFERLSSKLENTSSWDKQLKIQDKIIAQQKKLVAGYSKSATAYKKEYTLSLKDIKNKKNRSKYQTAIESGKKFSIQDFSSETLYNKVIAAQEAYNTWQDAVTQKQEAQYQLAEERMNKLQIKLDKQTALIEKNEARLETISVNDYKTANKVLDSIIKQQKESYRLQIKMAKTDTERVKLQYELKQLIEEQTKAQFDNIQASYTNKNSLNEAKQSRIQSQIDLAEANGTGLGMSYYETLMRYNTTAQSRSANEADTLQKKLNSAVKSGKVTKYSEEWYEMVNAIYEAKDAADSYAIAIADARKETQELAKTRFEDLISQFDKLQSNSEFMVDLLDYEELFDDDGKMTEAGTSKLGLLFEQFELSGKKAEETTNKVNSLSEAIKEAQNSGKKELTFDGATYTISEAQEALDELTESQQDYILSTKEAEQSIADFIEEGIQKEIDAYNELIDAKKEALDADEDLYEFQKKMKESTQDIALLEKQIAALEGDDSDEARKKRRELEKQLKEAQESQSDDLRSHAIDMQKDNLDKMAEQYEKDMTDKIDNIKDNLQELVDTVNENPKAIYDYMKKIAEENGFELPKEFEEIFNTDRKAISDQNGTDTNTSSTTKEVLDNTVTSHNEEVKKDETTASTNSQDTIDDNNSVTAQEVDKATKLKQDIKNLMQLGTSTSYKKLKTSKEKKAVLKGKSNFNQYMIKNHELRFTKSEQVKFAKLLGVDATTKTVETDTVSKKIKNKIKKAGFSKGGLVKVDDLNAAVRANGDDGLASVQNGEYILTKAQTGGYLELAKIAPEFVSAAQSMMDNINLNTNFPSYLSNGAQPQSVDNSVNITVEGNADTTTVNDIRRIAEDVVNKNQANLQRMAHNKGARISPWKR